MPAARPSARPSRLPLPRCGRARGPVLQEVTRERPGLHRGRRCARLRRGSHGSPPPARRPALGVRDVVGAEPFQAQRDRAGHDDAALRCPVHCQPPVVATARSTAGAGSCDAPTAPTRRGAGHELPTPAAPRERPCRPVRHPRPSWPALACRARVARHGPCRGRRLFRAGSVSLPRADSGGRRRGERNEGVNEYERAGYQPRISSVTDIFGSQYVLTAMCSVLISLPVQPRQVRPTP